MPQPFKDTFLSLDSSMAETVREKVGRDFGQGPKGGSGTHLMGHWELVHTKYIHKSSTDVKIVMSGNR